MIQKFTSLHICTFFIFLLIGWTAFGSLYAQKKSDEPSPQMYVKTDYEPKLLNMKDFYADLGYPAEHFEAGKEGTVYFQILLDENGRYLKHLVLKSSDTLFTAAAERNLKNVIFTPATVNQKPVKYWVTYPVHFKKEFAVKLEAPNRINPKTGKPEGWWAYHVPNLFSPYKEMLLVYYIENDTLFKGKTYRDGTLLFEGTYITPNDTLIRHGVFTSFSKEGYKVQEGTFINGQKEGIWKNFYKNGQISSSVNYIKDEEDGESQEFFENGQMSCSARYSKGKRDGEMQQFFENGNKITYRDDKREGETLKYSEIGRLELKIDFLNDEPYKVIKYNEDGSETEEKDPSKYGSKMPVFKGSLEKFFRKNMSYSILAKQKNVEVRVYVQFFVKKDGNIENAHVLKSSGDRQLDEEVLRIISLTSGLWEPGYEEGVPVKVPLTRPFAFKLVDIGQPVFRDSPILRLPTIEP